jgi:hypothetical protein
VTITYYIIFYPNYTPNDYLILSCDVLYNATPVPSPEPPTHDSRIGIAEPKKKARRYLDRTNSPAGNNKAPKTLRAATDVAKKKADVEKKTIDPMPWT